MSSLDLPVPGPSFLLVLTRVMMEPNVNVTDLLSVSQYSVISDPPDQHVALCTNSRPLHSRGPRLPGDQPPADQHDVFPLRLPLW